MAKTNTMLFLENSVSKAQEKVRGMLNAEFMKWPFHFSIIKLRFQLRYYRANNNSKRDISFFFCTDA